MRKRRMPAALHREYFPVIRMQDGGVYTPGVMPYEVVPFGSPTMNIPMPKPVSAMDGAQLMNRQIMLQQRQQALDMRKQQLADKDMATTQANFLDLQDKLFGTVHNPYQQKQLEQLRIDKHIPENITSDIFNNNLRLKELEFSISQAIVDPKFKKIMAEVGAVDKMRESARTSLNEEEYAEWQAAYDNYQFSEDGKYNITDLAPSKFKTAKQQYKDSDYATWSRTNFFPIFMELDPSNPAHIDQGASYFTDGLVAKGEEEAVRRGYIEPVDPNAPELGYTLTPNGRAYYLDLVEQAQAIKNGKWEDYVKKRRLGQQITQENRDYSDQISDENRAEREAEKGSSTTTKAPPKSGKLNEREKRAYLLLTPLETKYGKIDYNEKLPNTGRTIYEEMWTGTGRAEDEQTALGYIEEYLAAKAAKKKVEEAKSKPVNYNPLPELFPGYKPSAMSPGQLLENQ